MFRLVQSMMMRTNRIEPTKLAVFKRIRSTKRPFQQHNKFFHQLSACSTQQQNKKSLIQKGKFVLCKFQNKQNVEIAGNVSNQSRSDQILQMFNGFKLLSLATITLTTGAAMAVSNQSSSVSQNPFYVIQALGLLGVIVAIHEAGHFLCARWLGVHVSKFAIGFGPSLFQFKSKGVEYSFRALPLGGFVAFPDNDRDCPYPPSDPNLLKNRSLWQRALVISGGVIANFLFAYMIILAQSGTIGIIETVQEPGIRVPSVINQSSAQRAGIQSGDIIINVDNEIVLPSPQAVNKVVNKIRNSPMKELDLVVQRGPEQVNLKVTPDQRDDGKGQIGVQLAANGILKREIAENPIRALVISTKEFTRQVNQIFYGVSQIFLNFEKSSKEVSGPVAIIAVGAEVARKDISGFFQFASLVNLNLAVVNILPLPALDGGYLLLLAIEGLRGKKIPQKVEQGVMASGFLLLMMVGIVLIVRDTVNLGSRPL
eukprot:TRINITY_DN19935_c1_g1_i1.p1 TRINITY_DN19935_c1_g1~~TRINITY_DN19935_c1_g1_i1.p1  ORF type:complete len:497 (+),score=84.45 TRINITY_DN19935_c1_g1_i1:44-1492(+)